MFTVGYGLPISLVTKVKDITAGAWVPKVAYCCRPDNSVLVLL